MNSLNKNVNTEISCHGENYHYNTGKHMLLFCAKLQATLLTW